ncbi:MAG: hypothetical protein WDW38_008372 [Sanguina aurantia]
MPTPPNSLPSDSMHGRHSAGACGDGSSGSSSSSSRSESIPIPTSTTRHPPDGSTSANTKPGSPSSLPYACLSSGSGVGISRAGVWPLPAHRLVLAASSRYFNALFLGAGANMHGSWCEDASSGATCVALQGLDPDMLAAARWRPSTSAA